MNNISFEPYEKNRKRFDQYQSLLLKWNQKVNLTSITSPDEIVELHFLDSLALLPYIVSRETMTHLSNFSMLDIGSGGGFPGIPIKIVRPDIQMTLVESEKKKCDFMKDVIRNLGLHGISVVNTYMKSGDLIGRFDLVVSRATLRMGRLITLGAPNLKPGGMIVGFKGSDVARELEECQGVIEKCHLKPMTEFTYHLPTSGLVRKLLVTGSQ